MAAIGIKKKKKGEENPAAAPATEEGGEAVGGKKKKEKGEGGGKSKLITVVLIIVLVAAALFAGGVVTTKIILPSIMNDILKKVENNPVGSEGEVIAEEEEAGGELKLAATHTLEEMQIQLAAGQDGTRAFLVIEMGIGFTDKKAAATFEEKRMEIKDITLSTIMAKTKDELDTENDMSALKKVLASKIQKLFAEDFKKNQIEVKIGRFLIQ